MSLDSPRNRALAKIHIAKNELGLDDATYRDLLTRLTGKDSAKYLEPAEWGAVLEEFKKLGATFERPSNSAVSADPFERVKANLVVEGNESYQEALILALWDELANLDAFRHGNFAKLDTFMHRMGVPVAHPRFCDKRQSTKIIEALKDWLRRHVAAQDKSQSKKKADG